MLNLTLGAMSLLHTIYIAYISEDANKMHYPEKIDYSSFGARSGLAATVQTPFFPTALNTITACTLLIASLTHILNRSNNRIHRNNCHEHPRR
jgi:hypothetical protein